MVSVGRMVRVLVLAMVSEKVLDNYMVAVDQYYLQPGLRKELVVQEYYQSQCLSHLNFLYDLRHQML